MALVLHIHWQMQGHSHVFPINFVPVDCVDQEAGSPAVTALLPAAPHAAELATAFSEFIAASARLEDSYRELQDEVNALRLELSAQNAALTQSLAENRQMRLHLQQVVDSMPCGVLVLDQDGMISMVNPESVRLLALDTALLSRPRSMSLREVSTLSGINLQAWYHVSSEGQVSQEFCLHGPTETRWMEVRSRCLTPPRSGREGLAQTIFILRDVTTQRRDEQERLAGRKAMALAEMTTILAHEIRNPLASLELFAELIENDPARRPTWISNLRAGIRSLAATVNNVLSFHGSGTADLAPVPLSTVIDRAISFVKPLADQAEVSLEWCGANDQSVVMGNACGLQQVVLNLVSNAIRHTSAGGTVTISLRRVQRLKDNDQIVVEFADTGCGIRPDQVQHIFEPGFSGNGDTSGLGLAVCRQIMKQHKGTISVVPSRGAGARFELRFPLLPGEMAVA